MAANEIHKGDIGTAFRVSLLEEETAVDLTSATAQYIRFRKPSGTVLDKTASVFGAATNGVIQWTTTSVDDLDETGLWEYQGYIEFGASDKRHTDIRKFTVHPNLKTGI